jgi:hypothetical protein
MVTGKMLKIKKGDYSMNGKTVLWLFLFPPYGIYLLIKNNRVKRRVPHPNSSGNNTESAKDVLTQESELVTNDSDAPQGTKNKNPSALDSLSTEDLELMILGIVAFWGDNSISRKEMDALVSSCEERLQHLRLGVLSDPSDVDLSCKEYLLQLFDMISDMSNNPQDYQDIEIPQKYLKRKGKKYQPSSRDKIFFLVIDFIYNSYEKDYQEYQKVKKTENVDEVEQTELRYIKLKKQVRELAKVDGLDAGERDMLQMMHAKNSSNVVRVTLIVITLVICVIVYNS